MPPKVFLVQPDHWVKKCKMQAFYLPRMLQPCQQGPQDRVWYRRTKPFIFHLVVRQTVSQLVFFKLTKPGSSPKKQTWKEAIPETWLNELWRKETWTRHVQKPGRFLKPGTRKVPESQERGRFRKNPPKVFLVQPEIWVSKEPTKKAAGTWKVPGHFDIMNEDFLPALSSLSTLI